MHVEACTRAETEIVSRAEPGWRDAKKIAIYTDFAMVIGGLCGQ